MGGIMSGRYDPSGLPSKQTVEGMRRIDIKALKDNLNGKMLVLSWGQGEDRSSVAIRTHGDHVILSYSAGDKSIKERVDLEKTQVGYGERPWFCCPSCFKRVGKLYLVRRYFRCRNCHELTYWTCRESRNKLDYLALKIRRQQSKLGMDTDNIHETPIFKPKNMHWETFSRLMTELELMQIARMEAWMRWCKLV